MATDFKKGLAIGLLIQYFLIEKVFGLIGLGSFVVWLTLLLAIIIYFFWK